MKDCANMRALLGHHAAGRLDPVARAEVDAHLAGCAACRDAAAIEVALAEALAHRLSRHAAPAAFRQRLEARLAGQQDRTEDRAEDRAEDPGLSPATAVPAATPPAIAATPAPRQRWRRWIAPVLAAGAAAAVTAAITLGLVARHARPEGAPLVAEALSDHLRVVSSTHPLDIESGGIHQVRPWFTGRLDFAPRLAFSGDDDFPLLGGSLGYVFDRKAAVLVFKRRLHTITLLVFPPDGLEWPRAEAMRVGRLSVMAQSPRGFSVLLWRDGDLGYALISDTSRAELELLAAKISGAGSGG